MGKKIINIIKFIGLGFLGELKNITPKPFYKEVISNINEDTPDNPKGSISIARLIGQIGLWVCIVILAWSIATNRIDVKYLHDIIKLINIA